MNADKMDKWDTKERWGKRRERDQGMKGKDI
jgi:hypothetical protein